MVPSIELHVFSGKGGAVIWRGRLFQILSLTRGAYWKRGRYLKLGANSSIYGNSGFQQGSILSTYALDTQFFTQILNPPELKRLLTVNWLVLITAGLHEIEWRGKVQNTRKWYWKFVLSVTSHKFPLHMITVDWTGPVSEISVHPLILCKNFEMFIWEGGLARLAISRWSRQPG